MLLCPIGCKPKTARKYPGTNGKPNPRIHPESFMLGIIVHGNPVPKLLKLIGSVHEWRLLSDQTKNTPLPSSALKFGTNFYEGLRISQVSNKPLSRLVLSAESKIIRHQIQPISTSLVFSVSSPNSLTAALTLEN